METDEEPPHTSPIIKSIFGGREKESMVWVHKEELLTAE